MLKNFCELAFSNEDNNVIKLEELCLFYRESIAAGLSDFSSLEIEGFHCIQGFFILINNRENRIKILGDNGGQAGGASKSILKNAAGSAQGNTGGKITSISSSGGAKAQNLSFAPDTK